MSSGGSRGPSTFRTTLASCFNYNPGIRSYCTNAVRNYTSGFLESGPIRVGWCGKRILLVGHILKVLLGFRSPEQSYPAENQATIIQNISTMLQVLFTRLHSELITLSLLILHWEELAATAPPSPFTTT